MLNVLMLDISNKSLLQTVKMQIKNMIYGLSPGRLQIQSYIQFRKSLLQILPLLFNPTKQKRY